METGSLTEILESTVAVRRGLEALQGEHELLLEQVGVVNPGEDHDGGGGEEEEEIAIQVRKCKETTLNESLEQLQAGINEAKLLIMLANYVNSLEADKQKLKAQVKRLCAENNWLRQELTDHQQLLQETELHLAKTKEEKEHLEFLLSQKEEAPPSERQEREQSPSMDIDSQEEEAEGVHVQSSGGLGGASAGDVRHGGGEYEVPENIKALHHTALQCINKGRPHVAVPLCRKAVQELEAKKGRNDPDVASMLNILAVVYREQGKLKDATKVLQDTLDIREKVFGPNHPAVASTYNNLSVLFGKIGDYKTAEPHCRKALEIRQRLLGADHPDVAKQFTNLAILCSHLGKYDEVEYYYQRALEIYQLELGPDDPNVTKTMSNLANCYLKQGKYQAAETIYKKVLTTVQTGELPGGNSESQSPAQASSWVLSSPESPTTRGKRGKEEVYHEKGGWHKSVPVQSPTVSSTLRSLSTVYREQGRVETAEELERLTQEQVLDPIQQDRVAELLAETEGSPERPATPSRNQAMRQRPPMRPSLSQNIMKFFRFRGSDVTDEGPMQQQQQGGSS